MDSIFFIDTLQAIKKKVLIAGGEVYSFEVGKSISEKIETS
jgi:hypothetical protein